MYGNCAALRTASVQMGPLRSPSWLAPLATRASTNLMKMVTSDLPGDRRLRFHGVPFRRSRPCSIETVIVELGKNILHAIVCDDRDRELHRKLLPRTAVIKYFANLAPCVVAMKACGGSHFLAREVARFGHTPRLMAAQPVRPYVKSNKTDFGDAGAIYSASQNSDMRFVAPKRRLSWR